MHASWRFRKSEPAKVVEVSPPINLVVTLVKYSPDQPRDEKGRFAGGGSPTGTAADTSHDYTRGMNAAQIEKYTNFERQSKVTKGMSAADKHTENLSIRRYVLDPAKMMADYKTFAKDGEKTVNVDAVRPLFGKDHGKDGYEGHNAAAVQEASSAVGKDLWRDGLTRPGTAVLYAGSSGSGKTSAIEKLLPDVKAGAGVILDGNLSKQSSADTRIAEAHAAGKDVHVVYAYRDPKGAWVDGVIKRMLDNPTENGRVVPLSTYISNANGSLSVARTLSTTPNVKFTAVDNSLGRDKQAIMDPEKFKTLSYPDNATLRATLTKLTTDEYNKPGSRITKEQYHALLK